MPTMMIKRNAMQTSLEDTQNKKSHLSGFSFTQEYLYGRKGINLSTVITVFRELD
jgi:hypothetical protein